MPDVKNFQDSAQHCFELAKSCGFLKSSDFMEDDVALEAFELLTANKYEPILAHALGVSL